MQKFISRNNFGMSSQRLNACRSLVPLRFILLCVIGIILTSYVPHTNATSFPTLKWEEIRTEYIDLEKALWQYLNKSTTNGNKLSQIRKVFDSHNSFIKWHLQSLFEPGEYNILNHYEWKLLERDLLEIDGIFGFFKDFMKRNENFTNLEERAVLDICDTALRNDKVFSMSRIFQDIELVMVKQTLYYRAMLESANEICHTQQSPQQFVYSLYADIAMTELKGYALMEFSWMMLRIYGKGNFTEESELMRSDYQKRTERTLKLLREVMLRSSRNVWHCDPDKYVKGETYEEVTRLLQGYIENEVDMNNDETCREDCAFYISAKSEGCFKNKYCARQPKCSGRLYSCRYLDSDMWICPSPLNSTRRYEWIEYENGRILGKAGYCTRGTTKVDSWWRYLLWHCSYCFCLCDEQGLKSDRYFNLRDVVSDVEENKVVTGLRFVKKNRVFHLQIQQGELQPRGSINASNISWKPTNNYNIFDRDVKNGRDYHTLSYESRSIDLDDVHTEDISYIVTGVRFRVMGTHLNLEARFSEFNFKTGELVSPEINSFWKSNDNTDVSGNRRTKIRLNSPDISIRTIVKSLPNSKDNDYIDFVNSDMDKDAAQSTVPFIDTQGVVSKPPVPLAGVGIYHKTQNGYGGFVGPKIETYDFAPHVQLPTHG
ncbi:uncharacterized protein LOC119668915 isoform X2 [Teleopsis dalmanni]|uniref:uncharacterized protein LOC119668915 isoform X2 n=1 Tax=Teleopsis dalmanni TaxID=139649 RepID=UPI0018CDB9E1|nr:uncharacterized protein LOC119668915 isoform X2 [Teleopsis dalmanni]